MFEPIFKRSFYIIVVLIFIPVFVSAQAVINEIMYDLSGTDTGREWIEIYNSGSTTVDLSTWKFFENNTNHALNSISGGTNLAAGTYAIIADDSTKFLLDWPSFSGILFDSVFSLSNTGETVSLKDGTQAVIDTTTYDSTIGANGDGQTLQKSGASWIASTATPGLINQSSSSGSTSTSATTTTDTTSSTSATSNSDSTPSSTHYSSSPLSTGKSKLSIALSAGRDRLGSVGSPIEFKVETDMDYTRNSIFKWNFGDGSQGSGDVVTHVYEYPGEYVVVLNVSLPSGGQAVSRITAKIIDPELTIISVTSEKIELKNNSKYEANLFGRALISGGKIFAFPQDTIVKAGQVVSFSSKATTLKPSTPNDVNLVVIGENKTESKITAVVEEEKLKQIEFIKNQISILKQQMASIPSPTSPALATLPAEKTIEELIEVPQVQTASVPQGWLQVLRRFFLKTK